MSNQLTVVIPCKDEIQNIENCIASACLVADEILVADSGSTDGTLELAERLADRVVEREYVNSGDFKNWAIPQASHGWVLILDADERVTSELAAEIRDVICSGTTNDAFAIPRRNYFLGYSVDHGDWARDRVIRLIRRAVCRYSIKTDHAEIQVAKDKLGILKTRLTHYTAWELESYLEKMHHYVSQQAQCWHEEGKRTSLFSVVSCGPFRFFRSFVLRAGFRDGAIGFLIAAMTAYYSFLKRFHLWARQHGRGREQIDTFASFSKPAFESTKKAA